MIPETSKLLTVSEIAALLRIAESTVREWVRTGKIIPCGRKIKAKMGRGRTPDLFRERDVLLLWNQEGTVPKINTPDRLRRQGDREHELAMREIDREQYAERERYAQWREEFKKTLEGK